MSHFIRSLALIAIVLAAWVPSAVADVDVELTSLNLTVGGVTHDVLGFSPGSGVGLGSPSSIPPTFEHDIENRLLYQVGDG